jgi:predicted PilT family ATPase
MATLVALASFFKTLAKIIHFTEDSRDIQVRCDIVHIAEAFSSSNLVSAFLLLLSTPPNSR